MVNTVHLPIYSIPPCQKAKGKRPGFKQYILFSTGVGTEMQRETSNMLGLSLTSFVRD